MIGPKRSQNQLPIFMDDVTVKRPYTHFYTLGRSIQEKKAYYLILQAYKYNVILNPITFLVKLLPS